MVTYLVSWTYVESIAVSIAVAMVVAVPPSVRMIPLISSWWWCTWHTCGIPGCYLARFRDNTPSRPPLVDDGDKVLCPTVVGSIPWALRASPMSSPWTSTEELARSNTPSSRHGRAGRSAKIGDQTCGIRSRLVQTGSAHPVDVESDPPLHSSPRPRSKTPSSSSARLNVCCRGRFPDCSAFQPPCHGMQMCHKMV